MLTPKDIPEILRVFGEACAHGSKGLDFEEFCVAMRKIHSSVSEEDLKVLHTQIATNSDKTVNIDELLYFLLDKKMALESWDCEKPFPNPFEIVPVDLRKRIIRLLFIPLDDEREHDHDPQVSKGQTRTCHKGHYIAMSSDGILSVWTEKFEIFCSTPLCKPKATQKTYFSISKKMNVNDMVYLKEPNQIAICTTDREVIFFKWNLFFLKQFNVSHSLIVEDDAVNAMNYWSNGTKAVFSFSDMEGHLYVFISYNIQANGLFCSNLFKENSQHGYQTANVSTLLKSSSQPFVCVKSLSFHEPCSQVQYFPMLDSFSTCSSSTKTMVLTRIHASHITRVSNKVFESRGNAKFFTCVEHIPSAGNLVTGGTDGLLRLWLPHRTLSCVRSLTGHAKPITHIRFNLEDGILISLSEDMNVRVWSESFMCRQSFQAHGMEQARIASVCYNIQNNELVLTNTHIGKCLGRGTDVSKSKETTHEKPLCSALYHNFLKQVISVCQNGVVRVWDILTGKNVVQFKVTPGNHVGTTAMSFDEDQRRLITISRDGKVRLWNFNSGTELAVLPVTVPRKVTGIVCTNNHIFVSVRNSKIIFDLDMKRDNNRVLEHDYLSDISSMDVHENTLVTASSNVYVIVWDMDTGETLYWLNTRTSIRTHWAFRVAQGQTRSLPESAITIGRIQSHGTKTDVKISHLIRCLRTRENTINTATLLTSADGYIYAWSVKCKGGLLAKFRAVNDDGAVITTMSTDVNERTLLTGDSAGKIYLWDIQGFGLKEQTDKGPFQDINGWRVSMCQPPLLGSWQSSQTEILNVLCEKNVITAGLDHNVQLWTNTGCLIGLFGRDQWDATQLCPKKNADQEQSEQPHTAETIDTQMPLPESPSPSPDQTRATMPTSPLLEHCTGPTRPTSPPLDFTDLKQKLHRKILAITAQQECHDDLQEPDSKINTSAKESSDTYPCQTKHTGEDGIFRYRPTLSSTHRRCHRCQTKLSSDSADI
ncbi:hypothetical protein F2P81_020857 [Scophthalmus maximus]|uniref:WD repeat-containing protein on Y chromosome n=1 Tax=Scophthalmus maximus TaxID=52904 RepID=A0A6A4S380_SCOMX|nr:hypothetical protein F2P81_020857 [Scophthalmus maximus]